MNHDHNSEFAHPIETVNGHDHADGNLPDEIGIEEFRAVASHPVNSYREAGKRFLGFYDRVLTFIMENENPRLATWVIAMATGRATLTGGISQKELADRFGCTKASVSKCCKAVQSRFGNEIRGIEPMPGQRSIAACKTFANVRNQQLNQNQP